MGDQTDRWIQARDGAVDGIDSITVFCNNPVAGHQGKIDLDNALIVLLGKAADGFCFADLSGALDDQRLVVRSLLPGFQKQIGFSF